MKQEDWIEQEIEERNKEIVYIFIEQEYKNWEKYMLWMENEENRLPAIIETNIKIKEHEHKTNAISF